jgi:hypothetical protein
MQPFAFIWLEFHAARQRVQEVFAESPLQDEESQLNSSPAGAQPDGEIAGRGCSKQRSLWALGIFCSRGCSLNSQRFCISTSRRPKA